jgi:hypothetical protein
MKIPSRQVCEDTVRSSTQKIAWSPPEQKRVSGNLRLWDRLRDKVLAAEPGARLDPILQPWHVWCSICVGWIPLKGLFQASDFIRRHKWCSELRPNDPSTIAKPGSIQSFFKPLSKMPSPPNDRPPLAPPTAVHLSWRYQAVRAAHGRLPGAHGSYRRWCSSAKVLQETE